MESSPITVKVNGLAGHVTTMDATTDWTIREVREELAQEMELAPGLLTILKGTAIVPPQVLVGSLVQAGDTVLELSLIKRSPSEPEPQLVRDATILYWNDRQPECYRFLAPIRGNPHSDSFVGYLRLEGAESKKEVQEGMDILRRGVELGNSTAQWCLGRCYEDGLGVDAKDIRKALELYELSADQDNSHGQVMFGLCYQYGHIVEKDPAKAAEWFEKSAKQGDALGQINLGRVLAAGIGVEKDVEKAKWWYQQAADQGDTDARRALLRFLAGW